VSLENAERQNEQLTRELQKAHQGAAAVQEERRQLQTQLEAATAHSAELELRAATAAREVSRRCALSHC